LIFAEKDLMVSGAEFSWMTYPTVMPKAMAKRMYMVSLPEDAFIVYAVYDECVK
jgi:hypothetical protein